MSKLPSYTWALVGLAAATAMYYVNSRKQEAIGRRTIRIGTRKSDLAMWQANHVADRLRAQYPDAKVEVIGLQTLGDANQMKPLNSFGTTGVFTKELDRALLAGLIDVAVHCLKDLPTSLPTGLHCAAILERGKTADALVLGPKHPGCTLSTLPKGSVIGTSALRRTAVLKRRYPHLECKAIRGNVNTRLAKLDRGDYDALILAHTGLERLGFTDRVSQILPSEEFGYAVGQGALAILTRIPQLGEIHASLVHELNDMATQLAVEAERQLLRTLAGGCSVPIVVRTSGPTSDQKLTLYGEVLSVDGATSITCEHTMQVETETAARALGAYVANELKSQGAAELLLTGR